MFDGEKAKHDFESTYLDKTNFVFYGSVFLKKLCCLKVYL